MPCGQVLHKQTGYKVTFEKVRSVPEYRLGGEGHHARAPRFSPWELQATSSLWVGIGWATGHKPLARQRLVPQTLSKTGQHSLEKGAKRGPMRCADCST